ncbi:MAG: lamin tail domain-containing protein [Caldilineaceae bacterium]|nr:lamin tail domain-containing protein [Caldilineaceae bacterium]
MPQYPRATLAFLLFLLSVSTGGATVRAQQPHLLRLPSVHAPPLGKLLIAAAHIDSAMTGEGDEAILLWNTSRAPVELAGWTLEVNGRRATFPTEGAPTLLAGERVWCAAQATLFRMSFGHDPACEWAADSDPTVLNLEGTTLQLTNTGATMRLRDPSGFVVDVLLYGDEVGPVTNWQGPPVQVYARGAIARQGQIWQRKLHPSTGLPIDQDQASDWASDLADVEWGRRVRFPGWGGWGVEDGALPVILSANATITVAIAPEGLYAPVADALESATQSLDLSLYTFEHPELAQQIAAAAQRGVRVRLLLEGGPPGGITDFQRWCVRLMAQAGVDVRYLATQEDAPRGLQPRYRYTHAKYGIIDGRLVLVGSENFSWDAMPVNAAGPVGGRRGAYLLVDAQPVAAAFAKLFAADWAPDRFFDLQPYAPNHAQVGDPPQAYTLPVPPVYEVQEASFAAPISSSGDARFQLIAAPENAWRLDAGLHALIQEAGTGDELYLVQLYEHKYWGDGQSHPIADPNPRLQLLIDAARRGAKVRLLLDSLFDDVEANRSNQATVEYLATIAAAEGIDIIGAVGNPTGGGIHAKWLLARVDGVTWSAVGSLNGGEISHKVNREVVLMVDHPAVYARLLEIFLHDWALVTR